jgi:hypothetical protein
LAAALLLDRADDDTIGVDVAERCCYICAEVCFERSARGAAFGDGCQIETDAQLGNGGDWIRGAAYSLGWQ